MNVNVERLIEFIANHWMMASALLIVTVLLIQDIIESLLRRHKMITPNEAVLLMNDDQSVVVDVRESTEFSEGHIEGARNIPLGKLDERADFELAQFKDNPVIVTCQSGTRSATASKKLVGLGFSRVHEMKGGMTAWGEQNLPISKKRGKG